MKPKITTDQSFMDEALNEANKGLFTAHPNPRVGCVFVKNEKVIARGHHVKTGQPHAEINAIENASTSLKDSTCYVTLEPCSHYGRTPPCVDALIAQGIKRCVIASRDPNPQVNGTSIAKMREVGIEVEVGVLEQQAFALNAGFFKRMALNLPRVIAKVATSLDGKSAMQDGSSQWITSKEARADAHQLRAQVGAIVTSAKTVNADDAKMTARVGLDDDEFTQPMRVIIDKSLDINPKAQIFKQPGQTILAIGESVTKQKIQAFQDQFENPAPIQTFSIKDNAIDLKALLIWLGKQQINDVLVEAGPNLLGSWIAQEMVDQLVVYMAPKLMGSHTKGMFDLNIPHLDNHTPLNIQNIKQIGPDIKIEAEIIR